MHINSNLAVALSKKILVWIKYFRPCKNGYFLNNRHLQLSVAEMTQYLCNIKMCFTNCLTKKYCVPFFAYVLRGKIVLKYLNRPASFNSLNLTQYIR